MEEEVIQEDEPLTAGADAEKVKQVFLREATMLCAGKAYCNQVKGRISHLAQRTRLAAVVGSRLRIHELVA